MNCSYSNYNSFGFKDIKHVNNDIHVLQNTIRVPNGPKIGHKSTCIISKHQQYLKRLLNR